MVRHLAEEINYEVPVICAPGVSMCTPSKDKWMLRFWVPMLEHMLMHPRAHYIFHLGTNNVSNHKAKAPAIIKKEAEDLCQRMWRFNKQTHITFCAVLYRSQKESLIVVDCNEELRKLAAKDKRTHFFDCSNVLRDPKLFRRDNVHLSDEGVKEYTKCINDFLYREVCIQFWR